MSNEHTMTPETSADNTQFLFDLMTWVGQSNGKPDGSEWESFMSVSPQLRGLILDVVSRFNVTEIPTCTFEELFPRVEKTTNFSDRLAMYLTFLRNMLAVNVGLLGEDVPCDMNTVLSQLPPDVRDAYIKTIAADIDRGALAKPPHFSWCLSPEDKEPTLVEKVKAYISLKKSVKRDEEDTITIRRSSYNALRDYVKKVQFHHKIYTLDNVLAVTQLDTKEDPTLDLLKNTFNTFSTLTAEADMVLLHTKE